VDEKDKEKNITDDQIVSSVLDGNTRDFEILIDRYKKRIINFIYRMISDYDEAQSLAQDAFVKIYETLKKYKPQENFQSFIFTIAKNLTLNHIKKQKRITWFSHSAGEGKIPDHGPFNIRDSQHLILEQNQYKEMIDDALKSLKENQRIAFIMKIYLDFSYIRISEITGWSIPKIETLISRARSSLIETVRKKQRIK